MCRRHMRTEERTKRAVSLADVPLTAAPAPFCKWPPQGLEKMAAFAGQQFSILHRNTHAEGYSEGQ